MYASMCVSVCEHVCACMRMRIQKSVRVCVSLPYHAPLTPPMLPFPSLCKKGSMGGARGVALSEAPPTR